MDNTKIVIFGWLMGLTIYIIGDSSKLSKRRRYKLVFNIHHHKTHHHMAIISSLTLTSLAKETLTLSVVDKNNNDQIIPGILSNVVITSADSTADTAVSGADPSQVIVDAVQSTGGTTVTATVHFASTKMLPDGTTPAVQGDFTAVLTLVNNVVVSAALVFNQ